MNNAEAALLKTGLLLAGMTALIAIGIGVVQRLRRELHDNDAVTQGDVRAAFEAAYDAGEIDEAEYRRVRASLDRAHKAAALAHPLHDMIDPAPKPLNPDKNAQTFDP